MQVFLGPYLVNVSFLSTTHMPFSPVTIAIIHITLHVQNIFIEVHQMSRLIVRTVISWQIAEVVALLELYGTIG